ncbi:hypothetical protein, partial [Enterococcus faecium]
AFRMLGYGTLADMFHLAAIPLKDSYLKTLPLTKFADDFGEPSKFVKDFLANPNENDFWSKELFDEKGTFSFEI